MKVVARLLHTGAVSLKEGRSDLHLKLQLNQPAYRQFTCEKKLTGLKGASNFFEAPGKMDMVSEPVANRFQ